MMELELPIAKGGGVFKTYDGTGIDKGRGLFKKYDGTKIAQGGGCV